MEEQAKQVNKMSDDNPLKKWARIAKLYIKIPSNFYYYDESVIDIPINKELPIYPMTSIDELTLKTPDALLNGDGLVKTIESCCPAVKNARKLLVNDLDSILLAIRCVSNGDSMTFGSKCPKCEHDNQYQISIKEQLEKINMMKPPYKIQLDKELTVFLKPHIFDTHNKNNIMAFEEFNIIKSTTEKDLEDLDKLLKFNQSFQRLVSLNVEVLANSIHFIEIIQNNQKIKISNQDHILEWLQNIDKKQYDTLDKKIEEINKIGVFDKKFDIQCEKCENKWQTDLIINPIDFFVFSS